MRLAVSYNRFTNPEQITNEQQVLTFREFCQRHNLTPIQDLNRGRSAYRDDHHTGRLDHLITAAKTGCIEPGTVIVIEAWDRLGRLRPDQQIELIRDLLKTGVSIGVCQLNDIFSERDFGNHKWMTLAVFTQLAFEQASRDTTIGQKATERHELVDQIIDMDQRLRQIEAELVDGPFTVKELVQAARTIHAERDELLSQLDVLDRELRKL